MLRNRFLSVYTLSFAAGVAAGIIVYAAGGAVSFAFFAVVCGVTIAWVVFGRRRREVVIYVLIVSAGLLCGAGRLGASMLGGERYESFQGQTATVEGVIVESASSAAGSGRMLRVTNSSIAIPSGTLVQFEADTALPLRNGDAVTVTLLNIRKADALQRAAGAAMSADGYVLSVQSENRFLAEVRETCERLYAPYGESGVVQALLLRERSALEPEEIAAYRNAGLSHLLVISGLHLSLLVGMFERVLRRGRLTKRLSTMLTLLLLFGVCMLTSFSPSVLRAAVMIGFLSVGSIVLNRVDRLTILFAALLLLLLANPYALLSVSLLLSFLSCLGLLLLHEPIDRIRFEICRRHYWGKYRRLFNLLGTLVFSLFTTASIVLFTFPVTVFSFETVAYLSPLANLLVVPVFLPVLALLLLSVLIGVLFPFLMPLAQVLAFLPGHALRLLRRALVFLDTLGVGSAEADARLMILPVLLAVCAVLSVLLAKKHAFRLYLSFFGAFVLALAVGLVIG